MRLQHIVISLFVVLNITYYDIHVYHSMLYWQHMYDITLCVLNITYYDIHVYHIMLYWEHIYDITFCSQYNIYDITLKYVITTKSDIIYEDTYIISLFLMLKYAYFNKKWYHSMWYHWGHILWYHC